MLGAAFILWASVLADTPPAAANPPLPCAAVQDAFVVVDVERRSMLLCLAGKVDASYPVNLGRGGVGKTRQGDKKTPLGRYALSPPRASNSGFLWFIPIGYPTKAQRAQGYTGSAVGIHGPPDYIPQAIVDVSFDTPWTDGCVMVRTREEIEAVRAWMLAHKPRRIDIIAASAPGRSR